MAYSHRQLQLRHALIPSATLFFRILQFISVLTGAKLTCQTARTLCAASAVSDSSITGRI